MCGIVGVVGREAAVPRIIGALRRLEYRGYDSAGVATLECGHLRRRRAEGKLRNLERRLAEQPLAGTIGVGHTRWATHGRPNEVNAHPHATEKVAVVHNGIIENFGELRCELESSGVRFASDTDTEVVAHLVTAEMNNGRRPIEAVLATLPRLRGAFALAFLFEGEDNLIVGVRRGSPLALVTGTARCSWDPTRWRSRRSQTPSAISMTATGPWSRATARKCTTRPAGRCIGRC